MNPLQTGIDEVLVDLETRTRRGFSAEEVRAVLTALVRYTLRQAANECNDLHRGCQGGTTCHKWDSEKIRALLPLS